MIYQTFLSTCTGQLHNRKIDGPFMCLLGSILTGHIISIGTVTMNVMITALSTRRDYLTTTNLLDYITYKATLLKEEGGI